MPNPSKFERPPLKVAGLCLLTPVLFVPIWLPPRRKRSEVHWSIPSLHSGRHTLGARAGGQGGGGKSGSSMPFASRFLMRRCVSGRAMDMALLGMFVPCRFKAASASARVEQGRGGGKTGRPGPAGVGRRRVKLAFELGRTRATACSQRYFELYDRPNMQSPQCDPAAESSALHLTPHEGLGCQGPPSRRTISEAPTFARIHDT